MGKQPDVVEINKTNKNHGQKPFTLLSYYGLLPFEIDVLTGAELPREGQAVEVRADLTVVNGYYVEEQH